MESDYLRAQKGVLDLSKDNQRETLYLPYEKRFYEIKKQAGNPLPVRKKTVLDDFYWQLRDWKVSVFTPEMKVKRKISEEIIGKGLDNLEYGT